MTEESLFELALQTPEAERAALLDRECAGNPELRLRVEALLKADAASSPLSKQPPGMDATAGFQATVSYSATETPGTIIAGKYKLLQQIGEGGMGSVWMADQTAPVKRRVAVKLIRTERGSSKTILARFEAERQAIALMDHPNIAKLLDAGTTENSSPYFVMELVKGVPLTEFCDAHKLSIPDRLNLFMQICSAVQHAHQKGIIHRDLKPSNILVELYDDKPVPKVIDFGLAKATSGMQLTENTLFTGFGTVAGTPLYMAPEQANFNAVDIDTRADIYALGVILYELLTGTTPISRETIKKAALDEMMKLIREQDAPTPSSRLSSSDTKPTVAANRHSEPQKLGRYIKGELDWIVMKALSKERDRRYETANGFAKDIERFLNHEAVLAGPVSAGYRFKKFVRRNKGKVVAAGLLLSTLILGMTGTTVGFFKAKHQEQLANEARQAEAKRAEGERQAKLVAETKQLEADREKLRAEAGEKKALDEKQIADAVKDFLLQKLLRQAEAQNQADELLKMGGSAKEIKENPTIRELLDRAALELTPDKLETNFPKQPVLQAEILKTVGDTYFGVGEYNQAITLLQQSAALYETHLGISHEMTITTQNNLAIAYEYVDKFPEAISLYLKTRDICKEKYGPDDLKTQRAMLGLASSYHDYGKLPEAIAIYEQMREPVVKNHGIDHPTTLSMLNNLAMAYLNAKKFSKAVELFELLHDLKKKQKGADHPVTIHARINLASAYQDVGREAEAISILEQAHLQLAKQVGADHPITLSAMNNLAGAYRNINKLPQAIAMSEKIYQVHIKKLGSDHHLTLAAQANLAALYFADGKRLEAITLLKKVYDLQEKKWGSHYNDTLRTLGLLAKMNYQDAGKLSELLPQLESAAVLIENRRFQDRHANEIISSLILAYTVTKQPGKEEVWRRKWLAAVKERDGTKSSEYVKELLGLATLCQAAGKLDQSQPLFEEILKLSEAMRGNEHPETLTHMHNLANTYQLAGKLELAIPLYEKVMKLRIQNIGPEDPGTLLSMNNLAVCYWNTKQLNKSIPLLEETLKLKEKVLGRRHSETVSTMANLGINYKDAGRLNEAIPLLEEVYRHSQQQHSRDSVQPALLYAYSLAGKSQEAAAMIPECLPVARSQVPKESPQLAEILMNFSQMYLQAKCYTEAMPLLQEALAIRERTQPDVWTTFNTKSMLGGALLGLKKIDEAEPLLLAGYEGMKQREKTIPPHGMIRLPMALDRLIQLYTETNKPDEVKKWQVEKEKLPKPSPAKP